MKGGNSTLEDAGETSPQATRREVVTTTPTQQMPEDSHSVWL